MPNDHMLILKGDEVQSLLATREAEVMDIVRRAYLAHAAGQSSLPHSNFFSTCISGPSLNGPSPYRVIIPSLTLCSRSISANRS